MYGYGDAPTPYKETVDLVEVRARLCASHSLLLNRDPRARAAQDIVVEYASTLAHTALAGAAGKGGRMLPEDLLFLLRKVLQSPCSLSGLMLSCGCVARGCRSRGV